MGSEEKRKQNLYKLIAQAYRQDIFDDREEYYDWYRQANSLEEAIAKAFKSEYEDGKLYPHQYRVGRAVLEEARAKGLEVYRNDYSKQNFGTFSEIYDFVDLIYRQVSRFGELAHYDVSLRIAKYQDNQYPNCSNLADVYLHNGTLEGAQAISQAGDLPGIKKSDLQPGKKIGVEYFPSPLNELSGDHLENLFCIYKQDLKEQKVLKQKEGCSYQPHQLQSCIRSSSSL